MCLAKKEIKKKNGDGRT